MSKSVMNWSKSILITLGVFCVIVLPVIVLAAPPDDVAPILPESDTTIMRVLHWFITTVFGAMVGWFGSLFDYTVTAFILEFGDRYLNTNIGAIIDNLWSTVRDIFNLTFIFGLVYIGFQMILKNTTDAQKSLGYLIAAALLVNFSLFITKFIVDFSNIAAIQIHQAFNFADDASIGTHLLNLVGLAGGFGGDGTITNAGGFAYLIGLMMLLVVASFVFAAGAALVTIRYIVLNLYLVFSPIMFLGWVFPGMASFSRDYWRGFLGRAFFAPAFIFMIYLSFQILSTYKDAGSAASLGDALEGGHPPADGAETMAFFFLAMGFMIASLVVAQKMGAQGASTAIAVGQRIRRRGQRALTYPGRYVGRNVVNKAGIQAEKSFNRLQTNQPKSWMGKRVASIARSGSVDELVRNAAKSAQGTKFGLSTTITENRKRSDDISSRVETAESARNLPRLLALQNKERLGELEAKRVLGTITPEEVTELTRLNNTTTALSTEEKTQLQKLRGDNAATGARGSGEAKLRKSITSMTAAQLEQLSDEERSAIAPHLTNSQTEKIGESKELDDKQKKAITDARIDAVQALVTANVANVAKLSVEQLELMGEEFIRDQGNLGNLKQSQIDDLKKSKKFAESQRDSFSKAHTAGQRVKVQTKIAQGTPISKLTSTELETLGKDILTSSGVTEHLTKGQIDELKKSKVLSGDEGREIEEKRDTELNDIVNNTNRLRAFVAGKKPLDIAETLGNRLANANALQFLTSDILSVAFDKKAISVPNGQSIRNMILTGPDTPRTIPIKNLLRSPEVTGRWG